MVAMYGSGVHIRRRSSSRLMPYALCLATRRMVRGLVGDNLMLARINSNLLAHFRQAMDTRRLFCFAKNRVPLVTGAMAVVGGLPALRLQPSALSVVGRLPALSLVSRRSSSRLMPSAFRLQPCRSSDFFMQKTRSMPLEGWYADWAEMT
jgi:hypothetical protein